MLLLQLLSSVRVSKETGWTEGRARAGTERGCSFWQGKEEDKRKHVAENSLLEASMCKR